MGYRIIDVELSEDPDTEITAFLKQFAAFARFQGADVFVKRPDAYPGVWNITIEGNSSFLNELTPEFVEAAEAIAADINPGNEHLASAVAAIASHLNDQIVDWSAVPTITSARPGRELAERLSGESSFLRLKDELSVHETRIRNQLAKYRTAKGSTAWRQRHKLSLLLRVDSLALITTARRLHRIADDIFRRLPSRHLETSINCFDQKTAGLITLRDIAEHIDEYTIGSGRRDPRNREPGEVFSILVGANDVIVSARQETLSVTETYEACLSLVNCLKNDSDHRSLIHLLPVIADFDFMTHDGQRFLPTARCDETADQSEQRAMLNVHTRRIQSQLQLPDKRCSECNEWL